MNKTLNIRMPYLPIDFGIPPEYAEAAKNYAGAINAERDTSSSLVGTSALATVYAKGKADGRKEAMADVRELLGIENQGN